MVAVDGLEFFRAQSEVRRRELAGVQVIVIVPIGPLEEAFGVRRAGDRARGASAAYSSIGRGPS